MTADPSLFSARSTRGGTAVRLDGVSVTLGGRRVLESVQLDVPRGAITVIAGANGAGKSTLLGVLAGTVPVHEGRVDRDLGLTVAYVPQRSEVPDTLPISVAGTVAVGRWGGAGFWRRLTAIDRSIIADSITALGLEGLERRMLGTLSGGQRQRALVAQGLSRRADLLLLDEPTVGLDSQARRLIDLAIRAERDRGAAVVHASHDPDVIESADRVVRLGALDRTAW